MNHDHSYLNEDVIRVTVIADSKEDAESKARHYITQQGYEVFNIVDMVQCPHSEKVWAAYFVKPR